MSRQDQRQNRFNGLAQNRIQIERGTPAYTLSQMVTHIVNHQQPTEFNQNFTNVAERFREIVGDAATVSELNSIRDFVNRVKDGALQNGRIDEHNQAFRTLTGLVEHAIPDMVSRAQQGADNRPRP